MEERNKEYKYRAFISYSHKDKAFAKWLHKRIENYKIPKSLREKYPHLPKDLKRSIFRDEEELPTSSVLGDNLKYALDHSKKLIVICSPFSVASKWVNEEIRYFKEVHGEFSVLAIITSGEPKSSNAKEEAFPKSLRYVVGADGELTDKETEPLAGDARKGNDKEMALMKLIAGVLEVDFADLWEREKREARKRKIILSAVIVAFVALTFFVQLQSNAISSTEELKLIEREIIKTEYKLKEEQNSSVIKQLRKRLKELKEQEKNKQATLKQFGLTKTKLAEEAKSEYDKGDKKGAIAILESKNKETTNEQLLLARIYIEEHQYKKAKKSYEIAVLLECSYTNILEYANFLNTLQDFKEIENLYSKLDRESLSFEKQSCISQNLGLLYSEREEFSKAKKFYIKALNLRKAFSETNSTKGMLALAKLLDDLGSAYSQVNEFQEAEQSYMEAIGLYLTLGEDYILELANVMGNMATTHTANKQFQQAEKEYKEILNLYKDLEKLNPNRFIFDIAWTLESLVKLYYQDNRLEEARIVYDEVLTLRKNLFEWNPNIYGVNYAETLINGYKIDNSFQHFQNLFKAKIILEKFNHNYVLDLKLKIIDNIFNEVISIISKEKGGYTLLGTMFYMGKDLDKARKYYKESLRLDSNNSSAFINLYELQMISNHEMNSTFQKAYVEAYEKSKEKFIIYEMLKIIKNIAQNKKVDLKAWQSKYEGVPLDWGFSELDEWVKTLKDEALKKKINEALEVFKGHKSKPNMNG